MKELSEKSIQEAFKVVQAEQLKLRTEYEQSIITQYKIDCSMTLLALVKTTEIVCDIVKKETTAFDEVNKNDKL